MSKISEVPMLTADECEVTLGMILFQYEFQGDRYKKPAIAEVSAHRVISLDASKRHFRTRCIKGCEAEHSFSKGCNRTRIFGTLEGAKGAAFEAMNLKLLDIEKEHAKVEKQIKEIVDLGNELAKITVDQIKMPKELKV